MARQRRWDRIRIIQNHGLDRSMNRQTNQNKNYPSTQKRAFCFALLCSQRRPISFKFRFGEALAAAVAMATGRGQGPPANRARIQDGPPARAMCSWFETTRTHVPLRPPPGHRSGLDLDSIDSSIHRRRREEERPEEMARAALGFGLGWGCGWGRPRRGRPANRWSEKRPAIDGSAPITSLRGGVMTIASATLAGADPSIGRSIKGPDPDAYSSIRC